ncbi:MAG: hypothetical protein WAU92_08100, partial [Candidatus Sulfotelmatobacter sp.]
MWLSVKGLEATLGVSGFPDTYFGFFRTRGNRINQPRLAPWSKSRLLDQHGEAVYLISSTSFSFALLI